MAGLQQRAAPLPYAAPPVEESSVGFEIENMPAQGPDLLVFSTSPAIPKGEIKVPKASSTGRLIGSSIRTACTGPAKRRRGTKPCRSCHAFDFYQQSNSADSDWRGHGRRASAATEATRRTQAAQCNQHFPAARLSAFSNPIK